SPGGRRVSKCYRGIPAGVRCPERRSNSDSHFPNLQTSDWRVSKLPGQQTRANLSIRAQSCDPAPLRLYLTRYAGSNPSGISAEPLPEGLPARDRRRFDPLYADHTAGLTHARSGMGIAADGQKVKGVS